MRNLLVILACLCCIRGAYGWGQKGHDVTVYIAECHLTPEAARKIDKVLGGHSPVYYANWLDVASHTPEYDYTRTWHYLNVDEGETLETMPKNPKGDILTAVTSIVAKLKAGGMTPDEEALQLKMLIHLVGDMHCPMHLGRLSDLGGNQRPVLMFGRQTNLHSAWDTAIPEAAHKWSYTEWREQIDRLDEDEAARMQAGEPADWLAESLAICQRIYAQTPEGTKISYDYVDQSAPVIERQFLRGGYRLARLLNEIYDGE
ncbi:S1/P1 nuclease [Alistipes sp.]|uniref:S1/P1 nuclease n=1 Tax=Alistipes sp. TaxID=1872444 RepID=UPI003AF0DC67